MGSSGVAMQRQASHGRGRPRPGQELTLVFREGDSGQEIWPPVLCSQERLLSPPPRNPRMVSREQDFRHFATPEAGRPRVVRVLEQAARVGIRFCAVRIAKNTGQQP